MAAQPPRDLGERTFRFACDIVRFSRKISAEPGVVRRIAWQLAAARQFYVIGRISYESAPTDGQPEIAYGPFTFCRVFSPTPSRAHAIRGIIFDNCHVQE